MAPVDCAPSAWTEVMTGAAGNLVGGFGATLLWWLATLIWERRRLAAAVGQKRNAIALEIAKTRAWLRLLKEDSARAATSLSGRGSGVLAALVRLGPELTPGQSLEPQLGEVEHRLGMVEAAAMRLFVSTTGMATALRDNEGELEELRKALSSEADAGVVALKNFEQAVLSAVK